MSIVVDAIAICTAHTTMHSAWIWNYVCAVHGEHSFVYAHSSYVHDLRIQ